MRYKAILWDLDGTLLDTLDDLTDSVNASLAMHGFPPHGRRQVADFTGNGIRKLVERALPPGTPDQTVEETLRDFCTYYEAHCHLRTRPFAGIPALLDRLQAAGCRSVIVSNKADFAVEKLAAECFPGKIAAALGASATRPRKPQPDMIYEALTLLGVEKEQVLYVGDSEVDVATAAAAGVRAVFVTWGFRTRERLLAAGARRLIDTVEALGDYLFA